MRCYGYLRVSGFGQTGADKDGLPRQKRAVEAWAEKNGHEIIKFFREDGVCGATEIENRPALKALVAAVQPSDAPKMVVIEKLDRLARDLMIQETIMREFHKAGVEMVSTAEPDINSSDPTRKFIRQIFGAVAQLDKELLVIRLRAAREVRRRNHQRCEGAKPYGEDPKHPDEHEGVELMIRLRKGGSTFRDIAESLDVQQYRIRRGARGWNPATVMRILKRVGVR